MSVLVLICWPLALLLLSLLFEHPTLLLKSTPRLIIPTHYISSGSHYHSSWPLQELPVLPSCIIAIPPNLYQICCHSPLPNMRTYSHHFPPAIIYLMIESFTIDNGKNRKADRKPDHFWGENATLSCQQVKLYKEASIHVLW